MTEVTRILHSAEQGDPKASAELLPLVYQELHKLAAEKMAHEKPGQTLQTTALIHEAYVRLVDADNVQRWNNRSHFFAAAAEAMRRILVEKARHKRRIRHGGAIQRANVNIESIADSGTDEEILALNDALEKLATEDPVKAQLIQLRFFGGLTNEEAAEILGVSTATAKRNRRFARAWLHREINGPDSVT